MDSKWLNRVAGYELITKVSAKLKKENYNNLYKSILDSLNSDKNLQVKVKKERVTARFPVQEH